MLQNWTKLGLSVIGKINILKMPKVPKLNYVSNMLSLRLPRNALLEYNEAVYNFLWAGKKNIYKWDKTLCHHRGWKPRPPPYSLVSLCFLSQTIIKTRYDS